MLQVEEQLYTYIKDQTCPEIQIFLRYKDINLNQNSYEVWNNGVVKDLRNSFFDYFDFFKATDFKRRTIKSKPGIREFIYFEIIAYDENQVLHTFPITEGKIENYISFSVDAFNIDQPFLQISINIDRNIFSPYFIDNRSRNLRIKNVYSSQNNLVFKNALKTFCEKFKLEYIFSGSSDLEFFNNEENPLLTLDGFSQDINQYILKWCKSR